MSDILPTRELSTKGFLLMKRFDGSFRLLTRYSSNHEIEDSSLIDGVRIRLTRKCKELGIRQFTVSEELNGQSWSHIAPSRESSKSISALRGHTDGAFLALPGENLHGQRLMPQLLVLYCIRNASQIPTTLYPWECVESLLSPHAVAGLQLREFRIDIQESWSMPDNFRLHNLPRALVVRNAGLTQIRFSHSRVTPLSERASRALAELKSVLRQCELKICLEPGDLLIIHNRRSIHGRAEAPRMCEGVNVHRWLLRSYAKLSHVAPCSQEIPW